MVSPSFERILEIQDAELKIDQLRYRIDHHALRAELAGVDEKLHAHDVANAAVEAERHELLKTQKRLQDEVALVEDKRAAIDGKLYGGQVQASKELLALQDEAASLLARQQGYEDDELEAMEALEGVDQRLAIAAEARAALEQARAEVTAELETAVAALASEVSSEEARRDGLLDGADPELLARYRSVRQQYDGIAVARVVNGACEGCHIHLSAVAVDQMNKAAADAVFSCEECGRILVA